MNLDCNTNYIFCDFIFSQIPHDLRVLCVNFLCELCGKFFRQFTDFNLNSSKECRITYLCTSIKSLTSLQKNDSSWNIIL